MSQLYQIAQEYIDFMAAVEAGDIPEEAIADTLGGIEGEFEQKAENIACMIKSLKADAVAIKAEEAALSDRRATAVRRADSLKNYLSSAMQRAKIRKIDTPRCALSFRSSSSVIIADEADFKQRHPDLCKRETVVSIITKPEIAKLIKEGREISGVTIVKGENLQIK